MLDPNRILDGSQSNFGAPPLTGFGQEGSFLSIDPNVPGILNVPANFASSGGQASTLNRGVQMFAANSADWLNSINNPNAYTKQYTGVSNPLGLSNNYAFGRRTHRLATATSARPRSSIRPDCHSPVPRYPPRTR